MFQADNAAPDSGANLPETRGYSTIPAYGGTGNIGWSLLRNGWWILGACRLTAYLGAAAQAISGPSLGLLELEA